MSQAQPILDIGKVRRGNNRFPPYPLRLKLPDVELDVKAYNFVSPAWPHERWYEGTKLLVLLALSPKADGVRFDPSCMRYQPEGGQPGRPSLVQGPARKADSGFGRFNTCNSSSLRKYQEYQDTYAPITGPVPVTERACFRIFFDDDRPSQRAFTLFIEGISTSGKPLAVPPRRVRA